MAKQKVTSNERTTSGFVQMWLDKQISANCKSRLWFGLDKQLSTLVLNFQFYIFNQQRLWADGILMPHLHKALLVICKHMRFIHRIKVFIICALILTSFDFIGKSSEYIKLQKLELNALKNAIGKEYICDLTNRKGCNKTKIKYLGIIDTKQGRKYKILTSFFVFSTSNNNCHGSSNIKIYDMRNRLVGKYYAGMPEDLPETLKDNSLLFFQNSDKSNLRKTVSINLSYGLPKTFYISYAKNSGNEYSFSNED